MQQRQLRLGDILDDYCPRERRLTNHAVVAMVGDDVKRTRCTTCDAEHEYKHAKVPRQRKKTDTPAVLYAQALANGPKKVPHHSSNEANADQHADERDEVIEEIAEPIEVTQVAPSSPEPEPFAAPQAAAPVDVDDDAVPEERDEDGIEEGPVHRRLIRAQLPRLEGQPPAARPAPDFTIRQPGGRPNRFRPRHQRGGGGGGGGMFQGNRSNGNIAGGPMRSGSGGGPRPNGGRPQGGAPRHAKRQGRKRSK